MGNTKEYNLPDPRPGQGKMGVPDPRPGRADPDERESRKQQEKESSFDWKPLVLIGLIGTTLYGGFDKTYRKCQERHEEEDRQEEERKKREGGSDDNQRKRDRFYNWTRDYDDGGSDCPSDCPGRDPGAYPRGGSMQPRGYLDDRPRGSPRAYPREGPRDYDPRDGPRDGSRGMPRDMPRERPRGYSLGAPRDDPRGAPREYARDGPRQMPRDYPRDGPRDIPREYVREEERVLARGPERVPERRPRPQGWYDDEEMDDPPRGRSLDDDRRRPSQAGGRGEYPSREYDDDRGRDQGPRGYPAGYDDRGYPLEDRPRGDYPTREPGDDSQAVQRRPRNEERALQRQPQEQSRHPMDQQDREYDHRPREPHYRSSRSGHPGSRDSGYEDGYEQPKRRGTAREARPRSTYMERGREVAYRDEFDKMRYDRVYEYVEEPRGRGYYQQRLVRRDSSW